MSKYRIVVSGGVGVFVLLLGGLSPLPLALQGVRAFMLHVEDCSIAPVDLLAALLWRELDGSHQERWRENGDFFRVPALVRRQDQALMALWSHT